MELLRDMFLGFIHGIMGFWPVSSSGHFWLLSNWFGMDEGYTTFFLCVLKLVSILAILAVMFKDVMKLIIGAYQLIIDLFSNFVIFIKRCIGIREDGYYVLDTNPYKKLTLMLGISTIATGTVALFIKSIADDMANMTLAMGICFVITGVVLLLTESLTDGERNIKNMSTFDAIVIGIAQGVTVIPGVSRMAITYAMAKSLGYGRGFAVKYTIFLGVPAIVGSVLVNVHQLEGTSITVGGLSNMLAGMLVCVITSGMALKLTLKLSKKGNFMAFSLYGIVFGIIMSIIGFFV